MSPSLRAGQVADAAGVNVETLRYYERRGIIPEPDRSLGGHRRYDETTVTTLRVIKAAQRLGFTLDEVVDLLTIGHGHGGAADPGLQVRARLKIQEVDERIHDLQVIRANLQAAVDAGCEDITLCATTDCCPIPFVQIATHPETSTP